MNDGDWMCSDSNCGNINFARRNTCYRCNKERPDGAKPLKKKLGTEIGKSAAEKSRGLFNADDWQCNKCANVNWARRQTCNVCNAPKFGEEVEARTGYGGGYNERGVVEYRKREPSSDDEYDEFGRKKRKRKQESEDKVGITEGPVSKKLPPSMRASKEDLKMEPSSIFNSRKEQVHANGSLSDGSICDVPPLTKVAFRKYQIQTQTNYHRQNHMLPNFKANGGHIRKRFSSSGERDNIGSSGYETCPKICNNKKYSPIGKPNPVMENRVSSTNNDLVTFKFTGSTPAEDFQVTYSVEERVRAAALAVVYNNCKLSTEKFETFFDKPAPDFKTIFAWRQRLLTTGCLIDSHLDIKKDIDKSVVCSSPKKTCDKKNNLKVINPDEIPIISDTDDSVKNDDIVNSKNKIRKESFRSDSVETLLISGMENYKPCSAAGTTEDRTINKKRSISECTPLRTRSSSQDSQDSNYPDSDSEKLISQKLTSLHTSKLTPKDKKAMSTEDSNSDSISYNSDDVEFLSRVYGDGKRKSKTKKRHTSIDNKVNAYVENASIFQGYSTLTPAKNSPLLTANVYTPGLTNINVKNNDSALIETDGCSSEYIPTRVGSSTKKNYQEFKDNVKKKGFWAKGDGSSFKKNRQTYKESQNNFSIEKSIIRLDYEKPSDYVLLKETFHDESPVAKVKQGNNEDFTRDDFDEFIATEQYTSFDKSFIPGLNSESTTENTSRIFEVAQSDSSLKGNKSIMDIFSNNEHDPGSPEVSESPKETSTLSKTYEEWNEDDDALYNDKDTNMANVQEQSITEDSNIQYATQLSEQVLKTTESKNKIDPLMDLLKTFQATKQISDYSKFEIAAAPSQVPQSYKTNPALSFFDSLYQPTIANTEGVSEKHTSNMVNTSKKIHIIESVTIKPSVQSNADTDIKKSQDRELFEALNNVDNQIKMSIISQQPKMNDIENTNDNLPILKPQIDITNILSGINTNTLLLALQNLKKLNTSSNNTNQDLSQINDDNTEAMCHDADNLETINLTNDEDWEKETVRDGSIERELEKLDGNTGDTPFLGDIFDPSPVIPFNVPKKLNINLKNHETCDTDKYKSHLNENAPVIGNFKSFALPKPVLLNRLKLTVKVPDKNFKRPSEGKKTRLRKKNKTSASQEEQGDGDEEDESGDEADLSKYDLWGSDDEKGKTDNTSQLKEGESSKDVGSEPADNNDMTNLLENKVTRRSRSSSSSSSSTSSSSSSHSSGESPKNKFDDFNLNSERESVQGSPKGRRSRSRSPRPRSQPARRKSRDSRSAGESRVNDTSRDKEKGRERERRDRARGGRERTERTERRYSRDVRHR